MPDFSRLFHLFAAHFHSPSISISASSSALRFFVPSSEPSEPSGAAGGGPGGGCGGSGAGSSEAGMAPVCFHMRAISRILRFMGAVWSSGNWYS
mmetsp:Transcript_86731/g.173507  ORF Transcript_86731/g.173507 Transcript_86731/m.173507 type:complete len:94 (-) Transcript_86731:305-586(-)